MRRLRLVLLACLVIGIAASAGIAATGGAPEASFQTQRIPVGTDSAGRE